REARRGAAGCDRVGSQEPGPDEGRHGGLVRLMSKGRRATPARGLRSPVPSSKTAPKRPLDSQRIAVEIVAALADAVIVTGLDRRVLTANPAAAHLFGRPPQDLPGSPSDDRVAPGERARAAHRERLAFHGAE